MNVVLLVDGFSCGRDPEFIPFAYFCKLHLDVFGRNATLRNVLTKVDDEEVWKEQTNYVKDRLDPIRVGQ